MLEITVHIPALERLADVLAAANAGEVAAKPSKPAPAKDKPAPKAISKPAPKEEPVEDAGEDFAALRASATEKLKQINKVNGVEAVREALGELGVKNIGAVADEDLQAAIDLFDSKLA